MWRRSHTRTFLGLLCITAPAPAVATTGTDGEVFRPSFAGFGRAVAVVEGDVLVGEAERGLGPGIVYVYRRNGSAWAEAAKIMGSDKPGDGFGSSLDADGRTLIVGAASQTDGAAYIYERGASGEWRQVARLAPQEDAGYFGFSVALRGDVALVGAPLAEDQKGAVYAFRRGPSGWMPARKFTAADGGAQTYFGLVIAFDGTTALVTSPTRGVYAYRYESERWRETGKLSVSGVQAQAQFGAALLLRDNQAFVGTAGHSDGVGSVFLFRPDASGVWAAAGEIKPKDPGQQRFGAALALDGERLWIGAPGAADGRGAIYAYSLQTSDWRLNESVQHTEAGPNDNLGGTVAFGAGVLVSGMTGADHGAGKVAIYQSAAPSGWSVAATVFGEEDEIDPIKGRATECTNGKAAIFECNGTTLLAFLPINAIGGERGVQLSGIWGWTDAHSGKEYALVGRTDGVAFVDVTDPVNPIYVGQMLRTKGSPSSSWREI
jgi:hypothetical protein